MPDRNAPSPPRTRSLDPAKVAVVIACYNCAATIGRAIDSALAQHLPEGFSLEVIVVDDCSTDTTPALVEAMAQQTPSLIFVRQTRNGGPSAARNRALDATDAAWFTPLDSDDFMAPGRLAGLIAMTQHGQWTVVADNLLMTREAAPEKVRRVLWPAKPDGVYELTLARFVEQNLSTAGQRAELGYIKPLIDRRILADGPLYRPDMRFGEDYDLYTRLLVNGARFCLVDALGYYAVQRENSLSRSQKAADFERLIATDVGLLRRNDLDPAARATIRRHLSESQCEWAWLRAIDAVKARNIGDFISCFFISPRASLALIGQLLGQLLHRTRNRLPDYLSDGKT